MTPFRFSHLFVFYLACLFLSIFLKSTLANDFISIPTILFPNETNFFRVDDILAGLFPKFSLNTSEEWARVSNHLELKEEMTLAPESVSDIKSLSFLTQEAQKIVNISVIVDSQNRLSVLEGNKNHSSFVLKDTISIEDGIVMEKNVNYTKLQCISAIIVQSSTDPFILVDCPNVPAEDDYKNGLFVFQYVQTLEKIQPSFYYFNYTSWTKTFNPKRYIEVLSANNNSQYLLQFETSPSNREARIAVFSLDELVFKGQLSLPWVGWITKEYFGAQNLTISDYDVFGNFLLIADQFQGIYVISNFQGSTNATNPYGFINHQDVTSISGFHAPAYNLKEDEFLTIFEYWNNPKSLSVVEVHFFFYVNSSVTLTQYDTMSDWTVSSVSADKDFLIIEYNEPFEIMHFYCRSIASTIQQVCGFLYLNEAQNSTSKPATAYKPTISTYFVALENTVMVYKLNKWAHLSLMNLEGVHEEKGLEIKMIAYWNTSSNETYEVSYPLNVSFLNSSDYKGIFGSGVSSHQNIFTLFNRSTDFPDLESYYGVFLNYTFKEEDSSLVLQVPEVNSTEVLLFDRNLVKMKSSRIEYLAYSTNRFYSEGSEKESYFSIYGVSSRQGEESSTEMSVAHFFSCFTLTYNSWIVCGSTTDIEEESEFNELFILGTLIGYQLTNNPTQIILLEKKTYGKAGIIDFGSQIEQCTKIIVMPSVVDDQILVCLQKYSKSISLFSENRILQKSMKPFLTITKQMLGLESFTPLDVSFDVSSPFTLIISTVDCVVIAQITTVVDAVQSNVTIADYFRVDLVHQIFFDYNFNLTKVMTSSSSLVLISSTSATKYSMTDGMTYKLMYETNDIFQNLDLTCKDFNSWIPEKYSGLCAFGKTEQEAKNWSIIEFDFLEPKVGFFKKYTSAMENVNSFLSFSLSDNFFTMVLNDSGINLIDWHADNTFKVVLSDKDDPTTTPLLKKNYFGVSATQNVTNIFGMSTEVAINVTLLNTWSTIAVSENTTIQIEKEIKSNLKNKNISSFNVSWAPQSLFEGNVFQYVINTSSLDEETNIQAHYPMTLTQNNSIVPSLSSFAPVLFKIDPVNNQTLVVSNRSTEFLLEIYNFDGSRQKSVPFPSETPLDSCLKIDGSLSSSIIAFCAYQTNTYFFIFANETFYTYSAFSPVSMVFDIKVTLQGNLIMIASVSGKSIINFFSCTLFDNKTATFVFVRAINEANIGTLDFTIKSADFLFKPNGEIILATLTKKEQAFIFKINSDFTFKLIFHQKREVMIPNMIRSYKITQINIATETEFLLYTENYLSFLMKFNETNSSIWVESIVMNIFESGFTFSGVFDAGSHSFVSLIQLPAVKKEYLGLFYYRNDTGIFSDGNGSEEPVASFYNMTKCSYAIPYSMEGMKDQNLTLLGPDQLIFTYINTSTSLVAQYLFSVRNQMDLEISKNLSSKKISIMATNVDFSSTVALNTKSDFVKLFILIGVALGFLLVLALTGIALCCMEKQQSRISRQENGFLIGKETSQQEKEEETPDL